MQPKNQASAGEALDVRSRNVVNEPSEDKTRKAQSAVLLNSRGVRLKATGDIGGAIECYREALRHLPDCAAIWSNLGNSLLAQQQFLEAISSLRRAISLDPEDAGFRLNLATALNARGVELKAANQLTEAIAHYREALTFAPGQAAIWSNLGNALTSLGQQAFGQQQATTPPDPGPKTATKEMRLLEEAVQCHRRTLSLTPNQMALRINLAVLALPAESCRTAIRPANVGRVDHIKVNGFCC